MNINIIKPENLDVSKVKLTKFSSFSMGPMECKKIELRYDGDVLYLMGGKMFIPFGLSQFPKPEDCGASSNVKYHVNATFKGEKDGFEGHETVGKLYTAMIDLDMCILEKLLTQSGEFLSEETSELSIIDNIYARIIQRPSKEEYDPSLKIKMMTDYKNKKVLKARMYSNKDSSKQLKLNTHELGKHLETRKWIRPVFKLEFLYYINGKIYPSLEAYQLKIYESTDEDKQFQKDAKEKKEKKGKKHILKK
jgi:hypothetical protein